jgi:hypothetical protein
MWQLINLETGEVYSTHRNYWYAVGAMNKRIKAGVLPDILAIVTP